MQFDLVGVELGHLRGFADQAVETIGFFVDHGKQFLALCLVQGVIREQARDGGFDPGERSAQLMRDGIEQDGAQVLALVSGFGLTTGLSARPPGVE